MGTYVWCHRTPADVKRVHFWHTHKRLLHVFSLCLRTQGNTTGKTEQLMVGDNMWVHCTKKWTTNGWRQHVGTLYSGCFWTKLLDSHACELCPVLEFSCDILLVYRLNHKKIKHTGRQHTGRQTCSEHLLLFRKKAKRLGQVSWRKNTVCKTPKWQQVPAFLALEMSSWRHGTSANANNRFCQESLRAIGCGVSSLATLSLYDLT